MSAATSGNADGSIIIILGGCHSAFAQHSFTMMSCYWSLMSRITSGKFQLGIEFKHDVELNDECLAREKKAPTLSHARFRRTNTSPERAPTHHRRQNGPSASFLCQATGIGQRAGQRASGHATQRHRDSHVRMHHVCGGLRRPRGVLPQRVGSQLPAGALVHHRGALSSRSAPTRRGKK